MPTGKAKLLSVVLAAGACLGQEHSSSERRIADLEKQLGQLRVEMMEQRLQLQEFRISALEVQLGNAVIAARQSLNDDELARAELLSVETQLANASLEDAEKSELQKMRAQLFGDEQARLRRERTEHQNREAALREQLDRERAAADELRRRLAREPVNGAPDAKLRL